MDTKEFIEIELDVTNILSEESLVEKINTFSYEDNKYYKILFIGQRNFEIKLNEIKKLIDNIQVIKLKDKTKLAINLEEIAKESSLRGFFVSELLDRITQHPEEKERILKVIEVGLVAMDS